MSLRFSRLSIHSAASRVVHDSFHPPILLFAQQPSWILLSKHYYQGFRQYFFTIIPIFLLCMFSCWWDCRLLESKHCLVCLVRSDDFQVSHYKGMEDFWYFERMARMRTWTVEDEIGIVIWCQIVVVASGCYDYICFSNF